MMRCIINQPKMIIRKYNLATPGLLGLCLPEGHASQSENRLAGYAWLIFGWGTSQDYNQSGDMGHILEKSEDTPVAAGECGNKEITYETWSSDETFALGQKLGWDAMPGDVYALIGDLGVGKTVLAQGIADGLGITESVCSPTFTIVQVYDEGRIPLYHFDVYRIGDVEEMDEIGYEEYFYGDGLCLVEWADLVTELLPPGCRVIRIEKDVEKGYDYRLIRIDRNSNG